MPKFFQSEEEVHFFEDCLFENARTPITIEEFFGRGCGYRWEPTTLLTYFLPYLRKSRGEWPMNLGKRGLFQQLSYVTIELSDDTPKNHYWTDLPRKHQEAIDEYKKKLESIGDDDGNLRELIGKIIERLSRDPALFPGQGAWVTSQLLGVYIHEERRIILYPRNIRKVVMNNDGDLFMAILLSVLAHELFHAYHATKLRNRWNGVAVSCEILVESLARYNEYLFLEDLAGIGLLSRPADDRIRDLIYEAKQYPVDYWPYSGFLGVKKRIDAADLITRNPHYESAFLLSLLNDKPEFENSEIKMAYWHLV